VLSTTITIYYAKQQGIKRYRHKRFLW